MNVREATRRYEAWLARTVPLVPADLRLKHRLMAADPFSFLRATFYRWAQHWPELCPELLDAPGVLAVGDLHIENFGTWCASRRARCSPSKRSASASLPGARAQRSSRGTPSHSAAAAGPQCWRST